MRSAGLFLAVECGGASQYHNQGTVSTDASGNGTSTFAAGRLQSPVIIIRSHRMRTNRLRLWFGMIAVFLVTFALTGCGGDVKSASPATPAPTSPAPTPPAPPTPAPAPPTPTPAPPGSGGGTPAVTATLSHYETSIVPVTGAAATNLGKLTVDNGNVTYQLTGWTPNLNYTIAFCKFPVMTASACTAVNPGGTTDASGNAQGSFRFPSSGTWWGFFEFVPPTISTPYLISGFNASTTAGAQYFAALTLHIATIDQLKAGEVRVTNGLIHVQLVGAAPNATYHVMEANAFEGEDEVGLLMTDASGNGSVDLAAKNPRGLVTLGQTSTGNDAIRAAFVVP
jgi:hypothetical protein